MMFSKMLLTLPALVATVVGQSPRATGESSGVPSPSPSFVGYDYDYDYGTKDEGFFGEVACYGEPVALACDTDPSSIVPTKSTVILEDFGVTVAASIECEGTAAAAVCIGPEEGGGVGVIVGGDMELSMPMCYTIFFLEDGVKKYKSICRGRGFRIKQELHISNMYDSSDDDRRRLGEPSK
mmetsp:Transcript_7741/g.17318  ORF Transcript_7741/g.17318 Transcript_7741/m.17318 type:complete len:181 (-) Transcript_7741:110-652(-)